MRTSSRIVVRLITSLLVSVAVATPARAQDPHAGMQHEHGASSSGWELMQDGVVFLMFNRQGGPRGDTEWKAPNWCMGMGRHRAGPGTFSFTLMLSLDQATVGAEGYTEIFQVGETFRGDPLIDRQHPHDFLMQASASWRVPLRGGYTLTLAGARVGEPALGPVAFMHRLSSWDNPVAPLGHHTFDSTHIAMGVLTGAIERGPVQVESSLFNGREPDEQRWDLMDPGALDSWSVRGVVPAVGVVGRSGIARLSHEPRSQRGRRRAPHDGDGVVDAAARAQLARRDGRLGPEQQTWRRVQRAALRRIVRPRCRDPLRPRGAHAGGNRRSALRRPHSLGGRKAAHVVLPGGIDFVSPLTIGARRTLAHPSGWESWRLPATRPRIMCRRS